MGNKKRNNMIEREVVTQSTTPPRCVAYKIRLANIKDVRYEVSRVYREARQGSIPAQQATRLVYILTALASMIRDSDLEERIKQLEEHHGLKG